MSYQEAQGQGPKRAAVVVGRLAREQEARLMPGDTASLHWDLSWEEEREDGTRVHYSRPIGVPYMPEVLADLRALVEAGEWSAAPEHKDAAARVRAAIGDA